LTVRKILYVNGDSHSAGAEALNTFCFAEDDPKYKNFGRMPHPDNAYVSYGQLLAKRLDLNFKLDAESASSNDRILRTTNQYLTHGRPYTRAVIIGWATWEREEFYWDKNYYQFTAGMQPDPAWPGEVREHYRDWVIDANSEQNKEYWHEEIWKLHKLLENFEIPHLFFNTYTSFAGLKEYDWGDSYIDPYNSVGTYYHQLEALNFKPKNGGYHFGADAHVYWAQYLETKLTNQLKESKI